MLALEQLAKTEEKDLYDATWFNVTLDFESGQGSGQKFVCKRLLWG